MKHLKIRRKILITTACAAAVLLVGTVWLIPLKGNNELIQTKNAVAAKGDIDVYIEADGIVNAEKSNLSFAQSGTVEAINVKIGDKVTRGMALASLDSNKIRYQVEQARAVYNTAVAKAGRVKPGSSGEEVVIKEQALQATKVALEAERNIYNDVVTKYGVGSSQELAELSKLKKAEADVIFAESQLQLTHSTYEDATYAIDTAYANLQIAQNTLSEATLKAPIDGVVTSINGTVGQYAASSSQQTSAFMTISNLDNLVIASELDEDEITKIKAGQSVKAEFTSLNQVLNGRVSFVSPVAKIDSNGTVTYEVRIDLVDANSGVIDGMAANLKFVTKSVSDVVKIPNQAVKMVNGKAYVNYYGNAREVLNKEIITGFTDGQSVEVINGLQIGDKIIITSTVAPNKK